MTLLAATLAIGLCAGCSSAHKKKEQAVRQNAARAAQAQAWQQYLQAHPNSIRFDGPVGRPIVDWQPGLTLVRAIVEAGYAAPGNPGTIVVFRGPDQRSFTARQLLGGEDIELLPGDQVLLRP